MALKRAETSSKKASSRVPPVKRRGRPAHAAEKKREQILQAGVRVFLQRGYHATRIEDIVAQAGVGKGTFYLYFDEKEDVFAAAVDQFSATLRAALAATWENLATDIPLGELFRRQTERIFELFKNERDTALLILNQGQAVSEAMEKKIADAYREILEVSQQTLELAVNFNLLPPMQAQIAAICIIGAIEKVYEQWLKGELNLPMDQIARETSQFLQRGCGLSKEAILNPLRLK